MPQSTGKPTLHDSNPRVFSALTSIAPNGRDSGFDLVKTPGKQMSSDRVPLKPTGCFFPRTPAFCLRYSSKAKGSSAAFSLAWSRQSSHGAKRRRPSGPFAIGAIGGGCARECSVGLDWFEFGFEDLVLVGKWEAYFGVPPNQLERDKSRGTFPILSRDPSCKKTSGNPGKTDPVFGKNDG